MKRIIIKSIFSFAAIIIVATAPVFSVFGDGPGSTGYDFLNIPIGARRIGMAAGTAVTGDSDIYWWNPAGVAYVERPVVSLMHNQFIEGISQQRAGFTFPMEGMSAGAVNLTMLSYGDIDGYDWDGSPTGGVSAGSYSISYTQAKRFTYDTAAGLSLKVIHEQLDDESAFAAALDGGALFEPYEGVSVGLGWRNLGVSGNFIDEAPQLPLSLFFGAGLRLNYFTLFVTDISYLDGELKYGAGVELSLWDSFFFRGGWESFADVDETFRLGAGWSFRGTGINYAFAPYDKFGSTHRMDISFQFGEPPLIERIYRRGQSLYRQEKFEEAWVEFNKVKALNSRYKRINYWVERVEDEIK